MNKPSRPAASFRPAIWTGFLNELTPEEMAHAFAQKGWTELELSNEHAATLLDRGDARATGVAFAAHARSLGVSFPQGHLLLYCDILDPDRPDTLDKLKVWLDLFAAIGIQAAVLHAGGAALQAGGSDPARIHDLNLRALDVLTQHIEGSGITICLENVRIAPSETVLRLAEAMDSPHIGICLDTGHLNIRKDDPAQFIRAAGARLRALHLADNDGANDLHLAPYEARGMSASGVPWERAMPALRECGYSGLFNLEVPGERHCPLEARLLKLDYFRGLLRFLWEQVA